ncbi:MAG: FMN-binding negative transcriptional regulator [Flavobacterium sp.]|uniref:FMN-binding negative transcriptional regulator n=1 Tax=Flavobacterium sp. TaxID=239 RepID=UPI003265B44E
MYDLPDYKEKNDEVIKQFINDNPFAFISGCDKDNKPIATQIPVFIEEENGKKILRGHIMKNTDHHLTFLHNPNVLVVFTGHHTYVSATWYSNPHMASTWNYMSVHAKGLIKFLDDEALIDILRKTTLHFEGYNKQSSTYFDNVDEAFKQKLMKLIVAFEIEVTSLEHVFKLSQDRDAESYKNIKAKLTEQGGDGEIIACEMEKRTQELFPDSKNQK